METSASWRLWAEKIEVDEWIQSVAGVMEQGWNDQYAFLVIGPKCIFS